MVVPKMMRQDRVRSAPAALPTPVVNEVPQAEAMPGLHIPAKEPLSSRVFALGLRLLLGAAFIAILVALTVWIRSISPAPASVVQTDEGGPGWIRESSAPVNAKSRDLLLYLPSANATDYRLEFNWRFADRPMIFAVRAKDQDNYYATSLAGSKTDSTLTVSVERFAVYHSVEGSHAAKVLAIPHKGSLLRVKMDVSGSSFRLYLGGNAADSWTDSRLASGGFGFLEEPGRPTEAQSVRLSFFQATPVRGGV
jgi:hypothetical protein